MKEFLVSYIENLLSNLNLEPKYLILLFILMFLLIFLLPIYEVFRRKEKHLEVDLLFSKEPDFWGKSYLSILLCTLSPNLKNVTSLKDLEKLPVSVLYEAQLCKSYKKEKIFITRNFQDLKNLLLNNKKIDYIVVYYGDLFLREEFFFTKELVVFGNVYVYSKCFFNSMIVVDGNLYVNENTEIANFLHVEGQISVNKKLVVEKMIYCSKEVFVDGFISYKRIFSPKIILKEDFDYDYDNLPEDKKIEITGNIKIEGNVNIETKSKYVKIDGNLISDGDITIDGSVWVLNNIFSQKSIKLSNGVIVGSLGKIKSVIAKRNIIIEGKVKVYGYVQSMENSIISANNYF